MGAEDKWLNFSRCDLRPVFQSNHSPGFTPAVLLEQHNLSLQQCLRFWEFAALEPHTSHPPHALLRSSGQGQTSQVWEREGPISPLLFLPVGRGGSEGALRAALPSGDSLQQLPCCPLIHREGQQPMETRTRCSQLIPVPVFGNTHGTEPCELIHCSHQSGTHCDRQGKNFRLLRNGALWSLLLKALYNPSMKCAMKCKVLLVSQTKILFLFLKYLGISQHFPSKSVLYKNKYGEDKRDSSPKF